MTIRGRYVRPAEKLPRALRATRASVRDVQVPTGTEKNQTADTVIELETVVLPQLQQDLADAGQQLDDAVEQLEQKDQQLEQGLSDADGRITTAQQRADAAFGKAETVETAVQSAVVATLEEYALADDGAAAPVTGWSTTMPDPGEGEVVWRRLRTVHIDQSESTSTPTLLGAGGGGTGEDGVSVLSVSWWYVLAVDQPAAPDSVPPAAPWQQSEPVLDPEAAESVWVSALTTFSDDSYAWTVPTVSASAAAAREAYGRADAALTLAGSKTRVLYSQDLPSGEADEGTVWRRLADSTEIGAGASEGDVMQEFVNTGGSTWQETRVSSSAIANLDVGKLTVGVGVISDLVAQHIAGQTAAFQQVDVNNIFVTGEAAIQSAVIEALWADVVVARMLTATEKIVTQDVIAQGAVLAEHLAANSLDFMTARGMQLYAGYIEAPTIASSDKLGTGANKLYDPQFESLVDDVWVASGHLGDAPVTQRDTIVWDQSWTHAKILGGYDTRRNHGNVVATTYVNPANRTTGMLTFANYSWLNTANRTVSNPYTFRNYPNWIDNPGEPQGGGQLDPTFKYTDTRAPGSGTAKTTYLTNQTEIPVEPDTRWNIRLGFTKLTAQRTNYVESMAVEVIRADTSEVLWAHELGSDEMIAGLVNEWWDCDFFGVVKYRIKVSYTAGGGNAGWSYPAVPYIRREATSGWARQRRNGALETEWLASSDTWYLAAERGPSTIYAGGIVPVFGYTDNAQGAMDRASFGIRATSALFAQVEPEKGWRLSTELGLEFFNSLGARTARFDGEDNFFSGRMASRETGRRWELRDHFLELYDTANQLFARLYQSADELRIATAKARFEGALQAIGEVVVGRHGTSDAPGVTLQRTYEGIDREAYLYSTASAAQAEWGIINREDGQNTSRLALMSDGQLRVTTYSGSPTGNGARPIPFATDVGFISARNVAAGAVSNVTVTFPSGRFTAVPRAVASVWGDARDTTVSVDNITQTSMTVRLGSLSTVTRKIGAQYHVIQMTPTYGDG